MAVLAHVEVQALGNSDPHIHFAILSDFLDAPTETLPTDAEILEAARTGIATLNAKHADSGTQFFLFHRLRQWNKREGLWNGVDNRVHALSRHRDESRASFSGDPDG